MPCSAASCNALPLLAVSGPLISTKCGAPAMMKAQFEREVSE
jgi:hypothetical protein